MRSTQPFSTRPFGFPTMRRLRRLLTISLIIAFLASATRVYGDDKHSHRPSTKGYNCLFMGHSFFAPIARSFASHPSRSGFPQHRQTVVFHSGLGGTPGRLWTSQQKDVIQAKQLLATGTIDVLGLTYAERAGSEVSDYRKWVEHALKHNPKTRFIIQSPWARYNDKKLSQYVRDSERWLKAVRNITKQLRIAYPDNKFFCIPQGTGMVSLWNLHANGDLPEITDIKRARDASNNSCLFVDTLGHGGKLPVETGALLWLATIYGVDLNEYQWSTQTAFDLRRVFQQIISNEPFTRSAVCSARARQDE